MVTLSNQRKQATKSTASLGAGDSGEHGWYLVNFDLEGNAIHFFLSASMRTVNEIRSADFVAIPDQVCSWMRDQLK